MCLEFRLAILENQRQENAIEALSKKSNGMEIEADSQVVLAVNEKRSV